MTISSVSRRGSEQGVAVRAGVRPPIRVAAAITVIGGTLVIGGQPVGAATFVVTDAGDAGPGTLRDAIDDANGTAGADTITFDAALAGSTITLDSGELRISDDLTIIGLGAGQLTLTNASDDVLYLYNAASLDLSDVTIGGASGRGVRALNSGDLSVSSVTIVDVGSDGIGFRSPGSDLTVEASTVSNSVSSGVYASVVDDVTITDSSITDSGFRGVNVDQAGGDVAITETTVSDNDVSGVYAATVSGDLMVAGTTISGNGGHGLYVITDVAGDVMIDDSTISSNDDNGVEIYDISGDLTITDSTISGNGNDGVFVTEEIVGDVTISGSTLDANEATGIHLETVGGSLDVSETTVSNNAFTGLYVRTDVDGAITISDSTFDTNPYGIWFDDNLGSNVTISRTSIVNSAEDALAFTGEVDGAILIDEVTIAGNGDEETDLGLYVLEADGGVVVSGSTLSNNTGIAAWFGPDVTVADVVNSTFAANDGGTVIETAASLSVRHSTISGNTPTGAVVTTEDAAVTLDHTIATDNGAAPLSVVTGTGSVDTSFSMLPTGSTLGPGDVESDVPLLGPLADNGGATETLLPLEGSPAIGAGDPAIAGAPLTDQRGESRVAGTIEIGAVELSVDVVTPLTPARFADTRGSGETFDGLFEAEGRRAAGSEYVIQIAGRGDVPTDAKSAVLNVTAVGATSVGFVTVHACEASPPNASSLNFSSGANVANEIIAPLSDNGEICVFVSTDVEILVDAVGFVEADSPMVPVTPARYLDTRGAGMTFDGVSQAVGRKEGGEEESVLVAGRGDVPADAVAVVVNVTAVNPDGVGFVTAHPCEDTPPNASSLNYVAGVNRANELVASIDDDGEICIFTSAGADLLVDVVAYVPAGTEYTAVVPARFMDTRESGVTIDDVAEAEGKLDADAEYTLQVAGRGAVPADATAVVMNVTAVDADGTGFVTAHPCAPTRPLASSLNYVAGVNGANELVALLDDDGQVCLYTSESTHLIVDIVGHLS